MRGKQGRRTPLRWLIVIGLTTVAALGLMLVAASATGVDAKAAVSDPQELTGFRLLGVVSNVGVLVWASIVSVCGFTGLLLNRQPKSEEPWSFFFLAFAAIAMLLLVDDFWLIHELADNVVGVFIDFDHTRSQKDLLESVVFAGYGLLLLVYLAVCRELIRLTEVRVMILAFGLLAASLFVDVGGPKAFGIVLPEDWHGVDVETLLEESLKLLGIVYLAAYYHLTAFRQLRIRVAADGALRSTAQLHRGSAEGSHDEGRAQADL